VEVAQFVAAVGTFFLACMAYMQIRYLEEERCRRLALDAAASAACIYKVIILNAMHHLRVPVMIDPKLDCIVASNYCFYTERIFRRIGEKISGSTIGRFNHIQGLLPEQATYSDICSQ